MLGESGLLDAIERQQGNKIKYWCAYPLYCSMARPAGLRCVTCGASTSFRSVCGTTAVSDPQSRRMSPSFGGLLFFFCVWMKRSASHPLWFRSSSYLPLVVRVFLHESQPAHCILSLCWPQAPSPHERVLAALPLLVVVSSAGVSRCKPRAGDFFTEMTEIPCYYKDVSLFAAKDDGMGLKVGRRHDGTWFAQLFGTRTWWREF